MTTEQGDHQGPDDHGHDDHGHHDHGEFIAHHFESAEQQFDSGKLGIWVFLVTEILFFSGLFCAYTLYRANHPEIFVQAHHYLDKVLGGGNTIVLLFSSLTMALAVRAAQMGRNKTVAMMTLITMVCATIFLGVKAVEYSHKWDMGIFTRAFFNIDTSHHAEGVSPYLTMLSIGPAIFLGVFAAGFALCKVTGKGLLGTFFGGLTIMAAGYFIGAAGGYIYMQSSGDHGDHGSSHASAHDGSHDEGSHDDGSHDDGSHDEDTSSESAAGDSAAEDDGHSESHGVTNEDLHHDIGVFFSIYYCMTGLHAFHVIGGIIALAWIYYRSLLGHWRADYFGPVDYVGLYWHLVDLIWIFLFPLLYLIN